MWLLHYPHISTWKNLPKQSSVVTLRGQVRDHSIHLYKKVPFAEPRSINCNIQCKIKTVYTNQAKTLQENYRPIFLKNVDSKLLI